MKRHDISSAASEVDLVPGLINLVLLFRSDLLLYGSLGDESIIDWYVSFQINYWMVSFIEWVSRHVMTSLRGI